MYDLMMWKKPFFLFIAFFMFLGLCACYYHKEDVLYPLGNNVCDTTNITFKGKVVAVFEANCLRCHSNDLANSEGGGIQLEDYADVKARMDRIYGSMAHQSGYLPMPKGMTSRIDSCQIKTFRIWMNAGGLNN